METSTDLQKSLRGFFPFQCLISLIGFVIKKNFQGLVQVHANPLSRLTYQLHLRSVKPDILIRTITHNATVFKNFK